MLQVEGKPDFADSLRRALADRYEIEGEIGRGGMAIVYLARDLKHNRRVAIKALRPELKNEAQVARFQKEIQITASLQHPHVLALFDSGTAGDLFYYVMPFVDGETLRTRLNRERRMAIEAVVGLAQDLAGALSHAHARELVHRDVKPENILLSENNVLLADFGIARAGRVVPGSADGSTHSRVVWGTPGYMSPEQAAGVVEVGPESDVYSLACVVCEMLGAQPPFTGSTPAKVVGAISQADSVSRTGPSRAVTTGIRGVLKKALEQDPENRYRSAADFAVALKEATEGRSRPGLAGLVAAVAAVAVVGWLAWPIVFGPRLDPSRYVLAEFMDLGASPRQSWETLWYEFDSAIRRVPDIKVEESTRVVDRSGRLGHKPTVQEWLRIARDLGDGRLVIPRFGAFADSVAFDLYDVKRGIRIKRHSLYFPRDSVSLATAGIEIAAVVERLFNLTKGVLTAPGSDVEAAVVAWADGQNALDGDWNLPRAKTSFGEAIRLDPQYARAHFGLAQAQAWAGDPIADWSGHARQAAAAPERLSDPKERARARALLATAENRLAQACAIYDSLVGADSVAPRAWVDLAVCLSRDNTVLPDSSSRSGWRFRSSYQRKVHAFERALELAPSLSFRSQYQPFAGLAKSLMVEISVRLGRPPPPDSTLFGAYPELAGDTIGMVPYPWHILRTGDSMPMPSTVNMALRQNQNRLLRIARNWSEAFPDSSQAFNALSLGLELADQLDGARVETSALVAARRAARLAHGPGVDRLRAAVAETRLLVKLGRFSEAQRTAARTLRDYQTPDAAEAELLTGLALLTGKVNRAASLYAAAATRLPASGGPYRDIPIPILEAWHRFTVYAAVGAPAESVRATSTRFEEVARNRGDLVWRAQYACDPNFRYSFVMAFPVLNRTLGTQGCSYTSPYDQMQWSLSKGDTASVRAGHDSLDVRRARARARAGDVSYEGLYQEAWLMAQIADTSVADSILNAGVSALRYMLTSVVREPRYTGGFLRVMMLRAQLAARGGQSAIARQWAQSAVSLWRDADPELQVVVDSMKTIVQRASR